MAQTIKIKRSTTTAVPSSLQQGELAYSTLSGGKLFLGRPGGTTGDIDVIGGKYYVDKVDSINLTGSGSNTDADGTITGSLAYNLTTGSITSTLVHTDRLGAGNAGSFGSATAIPVVTVDKEGHVTAISTASVATALEIEDDAASTTSVDLLTDTLKFAGGTYLTSSITATGTTDTITFNHNDSGVTAATYGSTNGFPVFTVDSQGHLTNVSETSVYVTLAADAGTSEQVNNQESITIAGGTVLSTAVSAPNTVTVNHDAVTRTDTTSTAAPADGGTFTVVDSVTTSTEGHVTAVNVKTVTLPAEDDTLDSVTTRGNTTTNDITVNDLRVNGGTITGPATITIDPDTAGTGGEVVIAGNLTVTGTTTTVNSNTVSIGDNIIVLNGDETGTPSQNAGIEVERGTSANVALRWNETTDYWQTTVDGSTYSNLLTTANFETEIPTIDGGTF